MRLYSATERTLGVRASERMLKAIAESSVCRRENTLFGTPPCTIMLLFLMAKLLGRDSVPDVIDFIREHYFELKEVLPNTPRPESIDRSVPSILQWIKLFREDELGAFFCHMFRELNDLEDGDEGADAALPDDTGLGITKSVSLAANGADDEATKPAPRRREDVARENLAAVRISRITAREALICGGFRVGLFGGMIMTDTCSGRRCAAREMFSRSNRVLVRYKDVSQRLRDGFEMADSRIIGHSNIFRRQLSMRRGTRQCVYSFTMLRDDGGLGPGVFSGYFKQRAAALKAGRVGVRNLKDPAASCGGRLKKPICRLPDMPYSVVRLKRSYVRLKSGEAYDEKVTYFACSCPASLVNLDLAIRSILIRMGIRQKDEAEWLRRVKARQSYVSEIRSRALRAEAGKLRQHIRRRMSGGKGIGSLRSMKEISAYLENCKVRDTLLLVADYYMHVQKSGGMCRCDTMKGMELSCHAQ